MESKEKELFVVVSKEVEEKQLWMNQFAATNSSQSQNSNPPMNHCDSPDSVSSNSAFDSRNRDVECLKLTEVRNCITQNNF